MKEYLIMTGPRTIAFAGPQLDPGEWAKVKRSVENIGGRWDKYAQGWEFHFDVTRLFEIVKKSNFSLNYYYHFYETPDWLIDSFMSMRYQMAGGLYNNDYKVLEPSAGQGAILRFLRSWGMEPDFCEVMPENLELLRSSGHGWPICQDFMELDRANYYDLVFANPPFRHACQHIQKMVEVVKPGGRVCTLAPVMLYDKMDDFFERTCSYWEIYHVAINDDKADYIIGEPIFENAKTTDCLIITLKKYL